MAQKLFSAYNRARPSSHMLTNQDKNWQGSVIAQSTLVGSV